MISHDRKFLFIHIPKTAGNSIQNILRHYSDDKIVTGGYRDGVERFEVQNADHKDLLKHSRMRDYRKAYGTKLDSYLKFATIRNPFDRMASLYFFRQHKTGEDTFDYAKLERIARNTPTFQYYVATSLFDYLAFREHRLDTIIRFENLNEDFHDLCSSLDIEHEPLPVRNKSERAPYRDCFDSRLRKFVEDRHAYEIRLGGYSF